jgi:prevent-host-death family protein
MKTVNFQDADFSTLVDEAEAGEEIVIEKSGRPVARLVPPDKPHSLKGYGAFKGKIWIDEDRFDDPLPEDFLKPFGVEFDRQPGRLKHLIKMKDNFDDRLPPEIAEAFGMDS